jgi:hypothetical protein
MRVKELPAVKSTVSKGNIATFYDCLLCIKRDLPLFMAM